MGSSHIADSGRFAGQKSNFHQTCALLSHYLKQRGSFGDLNLGFSRNFESNETPTKTMNLLPMIEKAGQIPGVQGVVKPEPEKAQLTIFYAGKVIVFDDFPADKAEEMMLLASRGSPLKAEAYSSYSMVPNQRVESAPKMVTPAASIGTGFGINSVQENHSYESLSTKVNDLPIARKNSLTRFLEKRKDRISAKAPYPTSNKDISTYKPAAESNSWLGLAAAPAPAQYPVRMDRHI